MGGGFPTPTPVGGGLPTPTPVGGGFPTPTPVGGGFLIPTATPAGGGGFSIPTSTPGVGALYTVQAGDTLASIAALYGVTVDDILAANQTLDPNALQVGQVIAIPGMGAPATGPGLPRLSEDQLLALNLQPEDVPAEFNTGRYENVYQLADVIAQLRAGSPQQADLLQTLVTAYGWETAASVTYSACQPNLPVSVIYSEVSQFASPDAARAFFDDPQAQQFYTSMGSQIEPAPNAHGWHLVFTYAQGSCFPREMQYTLAFEYWGLSLSVALTVNADTDPALAYSLLDQLAPIMIAKVDALAGQPFPPTPMPLATPAGPPGLKPTPSGGLTFGTPVPTVEAQLPTLAPTIPPVTLATLADIERIMPTLEELQLPRPTFSIDPQYSQTYTMDELANFYRSLGLTALGDAIAQNAQRNGAIGQVTRVYDSGNNCPQAVGTALQVDITLFQTAQGPAAFLSDPAYLQAWVNTGLVTGIEARDNGLLITSPASSPCGVVVLYNKVVPHGRFLVGTSIVAYTIASQQDALAIVDRLNAGVIQKMDQAGLQ
ncbi:MAG: LysM peptidoglycan-binding domain-containing protein [Anaerolineae bacterium]|nr:LysM peptidoglycan-binding domain-containing protein [Anaerolineae bacterium]